MSPFTLSPLHVELPVASPLSLPRVHSLFFHHLIYLLHWVGDLVCYDWIRHEFQTWHTYSGLIPHSSLWFFLFEIISSFFFRHHISPLVIFILCLFFHYCLLDIISVSPWVVIFFTRHCMEDCHVRPLFALGAVVQRCHFVRLSW